MRIRVADNGIGIPKKNLHKIFDPFFTTKVVGKGSGLGLAMVYGIVQNARGYVHVETQEGKGTTIDLLFRVASSEAGQQSLGELTPGPGGDETVLLVDDEPLVRDLGTEILESYGYHVVQACDGLEALEIYRSKGAYIDLVVLDLLMPKLSGKETLSRLKKVAPTVKVLICSGYGSALDAPDRIGEADTPLVRKPFRPEELAAAVRRVLDGKTVTEGDGAEDRGLHKKIIPFKR